MGDPTPFWALDPATTHLNHGSFGACPWPVLDEQQRLRRQLEANPTRWFDLDYPSAVREAREALAGFVGSDPAAVAFATNTTQAVNMAVRAVVARMAPGDELLVTSHTYPACRHAVDVITAAAGVVVRVVELPGVLDGPTELAGLVLGAVGPRTRAVLIDHVESATGVVVPIGEIVAALEPDVVVIVDGAHAPGMVDLGLDALDASFYAGNLHKWVCAPKGAAFVRVAARWRDDVVPLTVSHGWGDERSADEGRFHALFDWPGTSDPTAWLSVPVAIREIGAAHPDGWAGVRAANHALVLAAQELMCDALGSTPPVPASMIGSLAVVPLTGRAGDATRPELTAYARSRGFEAKFVEVDGPVGLRLSAHLYNTIDDYARCVEALALF
ncbi:MAG TPA: aminotransferase class V-fold PLP-dependent enzyme [Cellulomonadaceae bacterium]|nr:aminotransferase class V-fold PLP-dependent enzyme [Cellulomonadaceae bacterium]